MQINITNGTLTQIQETLTASSGYTLPTTISVSGATSNYNSTTGAITLTNLTQTMSITATEETSQVNKISIGTLSLSKAFVGNSELSAIWLGNVKLYEKQAHSGTYVIITFTNGFNTEYWSSSKVYGNYTLTNGVLNINNTDLLHQFSSANDTTRVETSSGKIAIVCQSTLPMALTAEIIGVGEYTLIGGYSYYNNQLQLTQFKIDNVSQTLDNYLIYLFEINNHSDIEFNGVYWAD